MGSRDSGINCFNCIHFSNGEFKKNRRGCKIHDFVFPDVDTEIVCSDFKPAESDSDKGLQLIGQIEGCTALWYHMFPYAPRVRKFAEFAGLQHIFFSTELLSALDVTTQKELSGVAVDLTKAYGFWEKTGKRSATQLLVDKNKFQADVSLVEYRYKAAAVQKLILYSYGAPDLLQNVIDACTLSSDVESMISRTLAGTLPALGFIGISDDFSCVRFSPNELIVDLLHRDT